MVASFASTALPSRRLRLRFVSRSLLQNRPPLVTIVHPYVGVPLTSTLVTNHTPPVARTLNVLVGIDQPGGLMAGLKSASRASAQTNSPVQYAFARLPAAKLSLFA